MKIVNCSVIKNKKVVGKYEKEAPENIRNIEFVCLRSKVYSLKCDNKNKNKLKGISKSYSKTIKIGAYKKCLCKEKYQRECDNYILGSLKHEMYLQKIKKSSLSIFDDKRCYINNIESIPWN